MEKFTPLARNFTLPPGLTGWTNFNSGHVQPVVPYFPCPYCQVEKMGRYADDTNTLLQENIVFDLNFTCSCLMTLINNEEKNNQNSDAVQIRGDIFCCFFPIPRTQVRKTFVNT